ncbi:dihydroorotate dehydrogenase-like protein [Anaeromyxobacter diazotrophicus]|uniref:Dihydroorotate dehydrogenase n=1 Tax=Anaeromyxobacter diazotrophicus TaxID=2590199 RepID=A0A7I9VRK6_9BACT|nr:dihydroorotate dehydrogenase-like protein [Anaeromyxobacter diazotrophicus]GEJ59074.1 dihydroorotate dehydrogenase [Anaeromyxobacter diazotrophicus]
MADLTTSYLGLSLPSPLLLASSSLSNRVENFQLAEESGAGAVVLRSLFEEQLEAAESALQEALSLGEGLGAESTRSFFPSQRIGPVEYLQLVSRAKRAVRIPVIGSVNCVAAGSWSAYARQVVEAGADALEVNLYAVQADPELSAGEVEARYEEVVASIVQTVRVPVSVKLSPYFTSLAHFVRRLDRAGAKGYVLFNRFLQPDISLERMSLQNVMPPSEPHEMLPSLRWIALLYGRTPADLAASTGVHDAGAVVKQLLAGAAVVQLASALMKHGIPYLATLREGLEDWMDRRGFSDLSDFRGTLSQRVIRDPGAFERAQYVHLILSQNG